MRGKKFDAAEKHFQEKEIKLRRQFRTSQDIRQKLMDENLELKVENEKLIKENTEIKAKYEKMLEVSKLDDKAITNLVKCTEFTAGMITMTEYFAKKYL